MLTRATSQRPTIKSVAGKDCSLSRSIASKSERRLPSRGGAKGRLFHSAIFSVSAALASASEKNWRWRSGARTHISTSLTAFSTVGLSPGRDNCHVVMPGERMIAAVQHRVPIVSVGDPGLGVVGDQLLRAAADIGK